MFSTQSVTAPIPSGLAIAFLGLSILVTGTDPVRAGEDRVPVTIRGGHATDPRDHGRPVVLVAAALGVEPDKFREAFSGVTPARGRAPTGAEARRNKEALMRVLQPLGVTNDRLDEVSNYYRYRPERGELWTNKPAKAYAVVENGKIQRVVVTDQGAGYSSAPEVTVEGFKGARLKAVVSFSRDLKKNGAIASMEVDPVEKPQTNK